MAGKLKNILNLIFSVICGMFCILLGIMIICNLVLVARGLIRPDVPPSVFGYTPLVVLSGSMSGSQEGHIEAGDLILVKETEPSAIRIGDVISFTDGNSVVTHRVVSIEDTDEGREYVTRGDANNTEDAGTISETEVIGRYVLRIPGAGNLALFLKTPAGLFCTVSIPIFALFVSDAVRRRKQIAEEQKKAEVLEKELSELRKERKKPDENRKSGV